MKLLELSVVENVNKKIILFEKFPRAAQTVTQARGHSTFRGELCSNKRHYYQQLCIAFRRRPDKKVISPREREPFANFNLIKNETIQIKVLCFIKQNEINMSHCITCLYVSISYVCAYIVVYTDRGISSEFYQCVLCSEIEIRT